MIKVKFIGNIEFDLPKNYQQVETDEDIVLLQVFAKSDLANLKIFNVPVILIVKDAEIALAAKADDYIVFPFNKEEVDIRIKVCLARFKDADLSDIDSLTGLYNKKYFYSYCAYMHQALLSIVMIDLDDFKMINDNYGHLKGDLVLQEAAVIFKQSVRGTDILARFGGDEFIMLLPDTNLDGAYIVGERIRKAMEKKYTISVGVASFAPNESLEEVIEKADKALYSAKRNGKNIVVKA